MVPVHPQDRPLLGSLAALLLLSRPAAQFSPLAAPFSMVWDGGLFVYTALPFGLSSTPKIFTAVADALAEHEGMHGMTTC